MSEDRSGDDDDWDPELELSSALTKLQNVLSAAGFNHRSGPSNTRRIVLRGRFRKWLLHARLDSEWFHVYPTIGALPAETGLRAELLLWLMRAHSDKYALLKYCVTNENFILLEFW